MNELHTDDGNCATPTEPTEPGTPPKADSPVSWMLDDFHPLMPPHARAATTAFVADFNELLARVVAYPTEKWVAYYGSQRIGFGTSHLQLFDECLARFPDRDFDIYLIDPVLQYPDDTVV